MRHLTRWIAAAALTVGAAPAQKDLTARSFLPPDYNGEIRVDMARIVDSGMWDAVERSLFRMVLAGFRSELGFDLADLDRVRFAIRMTRHEDGSTERLGVWTFEGGERVDLARMPDDRRRRLDEETVGGVRFLTDGAGTEFVSPRAGLVVIGVDGLVSSVLRGEVRPGVPVPEVQSLTAVPDTLALIAVMFPPVDRRRPSDLMPIPGEWLTDDDPPIALRVRIGAAADREDVFLELLLRFANGELGPARFETELRGLPEHLAAMEPALKPTAAVLSELQFRTSGKELTVTLPLGADPEAAGSRLVDLATKLLPVGVLAGGDAIEVVEVVEEAEPATPPEKKKDSAKEGRR